jgi:PAS domain S-box-containing protein
MKKTVQFLPYRVVKIARLNQLRETVENLELQISAARSFVKEIESGNLSDELDKSLLLKENQNALGASLISMRDQMKKIAENEKRRNWATEGLAKFVDILRSNNDNLNELGQVIISNIVKYTDSNQGSIFILNDEDSSNVHLEMIACYAYGRKKHIQKTIAVGEGMIGQCVLEKNTVYMTHLPKDYLKITSGLGEALPKNLLIVPLKVNDTVYGAIELASFNIFENHHREFLEKLAESIASTVANVRVNEKTRKLLHETQEQAELVRSQEEEMRQNMEELAATQEEMQRILREVEGKEAYLSQVLNVSKDAIFTIDRSYKLTTWNKAFAATLEQFGLKLDKGMDTLDWYQGEERTNQKKLYDRAFDGESFEFTLSSERNGSTHYHLSTYAPLRKDNGDIYEIVCFAKDITAMMVAQKSAEKMRDEAQQQAEALKAQEEELRQNMEELSATQDEMQRILREVENKEAYLSQVLNVSSDSIFTVDREYKLVSWNTGFAKTLEQYGLQLQKGMDTLAWYQGEDYAKQKGYYDRALNGESFDFTLTSEQNGETIYHLSLYAPLRRENGEVFEVACFAKDVTPMVKAQKTAERLYQEAQNQSEELKAQEEELRQNMEELSATQDEMQRIMRELETKEKYVNQLLNVSKDAIYSVNKEYKLVSWNQAFAATLEKFGLKLEKGMSTIDWYPEEERVAQKKIYERAFKGESFEITASSDQNGVEFHHLSVFAPLKDEAGEVYEVAVFAKDVTTITRTQKEAERLAREAKLNETYLDSLINASKDAIFTLDKEFKLISFNNGFSEGVRAMGINLEKGFKMLDLFPDKKQKSEQRALYERAFKGEIFEVTSEFNFDGQISYYNSSFSPLRNEKGEIYAIAVFGRDMTELISSKNAAERLARETKEANEEMKAQEEELRQNMEELSATQEEMQRIMAELEVKNHYTTELLNATDDGIFTINREYRIESWNKTFEDSMAQYGTKITKGLNTLDWYAEGKQRKDQIAVFERVFAGETIASTYASDVNGETYHFKNVLKPIRNKAGEIIEIAMITRDVTDTAQAAAGKASRQGKNSK